MYKNDRGFSETTVLIAFGVIIVILFSMVFIISFQNSSTTMLPFEKTVVEYNNTVQNFSKIIVPLMPIRIHLQSGNESQTLYKISVKTKYPGESVSVWWNEETCIVESDRFRSIKKCSDNNGYVTNPQTLVGVSDDYNVVDTTISVGGPMRQNPIIVISGNTLSPNYVDIEIKRTV